MKRALTLILPALLLLAAPLDVAAKGGGRGVGGKSSVTRSGGSSGSSVHVRGYTRKDGTRVQPHHRSAPDLRKSNNWSTRGNGNPYTGKPGTQSP